MNTALSVITNTFDYSAIDADTASDLRAQARRIRKRIGKATQDLIDIGRDLLAAKKNLLDHGDFIKWVESEVGIVRRTAQAYMALAKLADDNGAAIALLPPTTAHRLAAKSVPPEIVSKVVSKALSGEVLADRTVAEMISIAKSSKDRTEVRVGYRELQEAKEAAARRNREKKTSEAAETLLKSLGADGVALVIKVFAEEEWPWGLLSELRKKMLLKKKVADCGATH